MAPISSRMAASVAPKSSSPPPARRSSRCKRLASSTSSI
nr:MAG: hypothetical protein [Molluscum contagiosum virus]